MQHLRRDILRWFGAAGLLPFAGCGDDGSGVAPDAAPGGDGSTCAVIPDETAGPFPGNGSNGKNVLVESGIVRSDIRSSFAGASGVAIGIPLRLEIQLVDTRTSCGPLAGYAIYLWHPDKNGDYSMYAAAIASENYLRGVQETGVDGGAAFQTIFPGCYPGRMPHMHFEIYPSLATATTSANKVKTSQLGFPDGPCDAVYATSEYATSKQHYANVSFETDTAFRDGRSLQIATVTGDVTAGFVARLQIAIAA